MSHTLLSADSGSVLAADSNPLPYYTIRDIAIAALKDVGVLGIGMSPQNEDLNDALFKLNGMIAQWRRKRWLNYHLLDLSVVATGATSYPIGPVGPLAQTGAIYMPSRPDKLEAAYVRQLILAGNAPNAGPVDYPLTLIQSYEEYSRIALKSLVSFHRTFYFKRSMHCRDFLNYISFFYRPYRVLWSRRYKSQTPITVLQANITDCK